MADTAKQAGRAQTHLEFVIGLGRAFAGALIFSLPMLMTMEMWWLGFTIEPIRLGILMTLLVPLLVRMSRYGGIRPTSTLLDDIQDSMVVIAVAAVACSIVLWLFGVIGPGMAVSENVGKIAVQIVPASIGAMLARNQLGSSDADDEEERQEASYGGELFLMAIGALFLSLNMSPTEEMILIAYRMTVWQEMAFILLTIALMHVFVYRLELRGSHRRAEGEGFVGIFLRFTVTGYAIVFVVSLYVLWTFGRIDGVGMEEVVSMAVVLSFPGAIGASVARLIV